MTRTTETTTSRLTAPSRSLAVPIALTFTAACWGYLVLLRSEMADMPAMATMSEMPVIRSTTSALAMPMTSAWTSGDVLLMFTMWAVMMTAMMLPSASPMIRAYHATVRSRASSGVSSTSLFVAGYLVAWSGFAAAATATQWKLHDLALVDAMGVSTSRWVAGVILLAAGGYQFSRVKEACLGKCRTPLGFLLSEWRSGRNGALVMGLHHGSLCIGCCWALMALLFVLGVMNLWWIAAVAAIVLIEKFTRTAALPRIFGAALMVWATFVLTGITEMGVPA